MVLLSRREAKLKSEREGGREGGGGREDGRAYFLMDFLFCLQTLAVSL